MAKDVIMPALGIAQETGILVQWLKQEGETVAKGEPIMEIETDKVTVEIEATANGILANVTAQAGDEIPVGQAIAVIVAPGEAVPDRPTPAAAAPAPAVQPTQPPQQTEPDAPTPETTGNAGSSVASPLAARMAAEHGLTLAQIKPNGGRVEKSDVLAYLEGGAGKADGSQGNGARLTPASPKARRLAQERGLDVATLVGSGPGGAVLAADVLSGRVVEAPPAIIDGDQSLELSRVWRVMAGRMVEAWTSIPHFYLVRDANASRFVAWYEATKEKSAEKLTYTDLLVKVVAAALRKHPRANAQWDGDGIRLMGNVNVGLAVAVEDGLMVPVIHGADKLSLGEIAAARKGVVSRAQEGKLRPDDLQGGTFTISNLGMFGIDTFSAIVNPPQAAILAVGRIAERVVAVDGQPAVQPMMMLSLSCDHRTIDGARAAQFMQTLVGLIEEPLGMVS